MHLKKTFYYIRFIFIYVISVRLFFRKPCECEVRCMNEFHILSLHIIVFFKTPNSM